MEDTNKIWSKIKKGINQAAGGGEENKKGQQEIIGLRNNVK